MSNIWKWTTILYAVLTGYESPTRPAALGTVCLVLGHWRYRSLLGTLLTCEPSDSLLWKLSCASVCAAASLALTYIAPRRSWSNLSPVVAKCPLLRMAVLKIGSRLKPMISSSFPTGRPFQQRTEKWDITDFTKWVPWITLYLPDNIL